LILPVALVLPGFAADHALAARARPAPVENAPPEAPVEHVPTPYVAIDVDSGRVISQRNATRAWYPASVTKLMTVYVALQAVGTGRLTLDTPMYVSARAARAKPSKMGFTPGAQVTLSNALKMLMVKSANDISITIAEGVSGSVEAFADEMNQAARSLGMQESHFVNPNGLHDPNHYSSARDMAILGRALLLRFPEHADLFNIGAFKIGDQIVPTHNGLIGRYPGADGMKTGFTCPAGFNLVASATRAGRKVIVVVMGDTSARLRTARAADLLDQAFSSGSSADAITDLPSVGGTPPNMRGEACARRKKAPVAAENEDLAATGSDGEQGGSGSQSNGAVIAALPRPVFNPIDLYVGPPAGYQGPIAGPRPANTPIGAIAYARAKGAEAASAIADHATPAPKPAAAPTGKKAKTMQAKAKAKPVVHAAAEKPKEGPKGKIKAGKPSSAKPKHGKSNAKAASH
jgi:D-alanyl-D-alanine carboxypeptidase